jgi:hypothetical protein
MRSSLPVRCDGLSQRQEPGREPPQPRHTRAPLLADGLYEREAGSEGLTGALPYPSNARLRQLPKGRTVSALEAARGELTKGGPPRRALRAFVFRRGRP